MFHRSYVGLDAKGRFGLFSQSELIYTTGKYRFDVDSEMDNTYTKTNTLRLALRPGLAVFMMNNVSVHASIGVGGVSYNHYKYFEDGVQVGKRSAGKANFKINITDINIGVAIHLWKRNR